jgi:alpha-1,2-mannosyltransferase
VIGGLPAVARSAKAGLLAGAVLAALAALFAFKAAAKMPDYEVYWRAGVRALAAEPLYREEDAHFRLKYLPAFAVLSIPAGLLPLTASKAVWFTVSVGLIPILISLSLALPRTRTRPPWLLAGLTFVLMAKFYGHELILGQVNVLFGVLIVAAVLAMMDGRKTACGLLFALAVVIKPYAVLFLPWLLAQREIRTLAWAGVGIAAALVLPVPIYGVQGTATLHWAWWQTVSESTAPNLLNADNVSLAAMFAKWLGVGPPAAIAATLSAVLLLANAAAVFLARRRVGGPAGLEAALLLTMIPLLSPQGWDYVFLIATPAVVYIVNYDGELPRALRAITWTALAVIAFSLYDIVGRAAYSRFMALSIISVCFLVVVWALTALRWRRIA